MSYTYFVSYSYRTRGPEEIPAFANEVLIRPEPIDSFETLNKIEMEILDQIPKGRDVTIINFIKLDSHETE